MDRRLAREDPDGQIERDQQRPRRTALDTPRFETLDESKKKLPAKGPHTCREETERVKMHGSCRVSRKW
jgi:hypothetical protein